MKTKPLHNKSEMEIISIDLMSLIRRERRNIGHQNQMNECKEKIADLKEGIDQEMISGIFFKTKD